MVFVLVLLHKYSRITPGVNNMEKAVLFDMDGILYDSERFYMDITVRVMRELGYKGPEEPLWSVVGTTAEKTWKILYDLLEGSHTGREIERKWVAYCRENPLDYKAVMFPDIPSSLKRLKEHGYRMACCSSNTPSVIGKSLDAMNIREYFSYVVSSEEIERAKPDPMIYLLASEKIGAAPGSCYVYEDSTLGIEAGKRAGMKVIARKDDRFSMDQSRADRIVTCAAEMADYVLMEEANAGSN